MARQLTILVKDDRYVLGTWSEVFVVLWKQQPDLGRARTMGDAFRRFVARGPAGVLVVVPGDIPAPDDDARGSIVDAMRTDPAATRFLAYVIEGAGFGAATMRSVVTGTLLAARPPYPVKVFATLSESVAWLGERIGDVAGLESSLVALQR